MKIIENTDSSLVDEIKLAIKQNDGHCPCAIQHTPETKCVCQDFRDKIQDTTYEGFCNCSLYYKYLN